MSDLIYNWIDIIWVPVAFFVVHKGHRWWAVAFIIMSMVLIRLMAELLSYSGYPYGIMGFMTSNVYERGVVTSSIFYALFLFMAHYSKNTEGIIFMAASISFIFMIFITTSIIMVL